MAWRRGGWWGKYEIGGGDGRGVVRGEGCGKDGGARNRGPGIGEGTVGALWGDERRGGAAGRGSEGVGGSGRKCGRPSSFPHPRLSNPPGLLGP